MDIQKPPSKYILALDLDPEKDRERLLSIFSHEAPPDEIYKENSGRKPNITPRFQLFSGFLYLVNHQNDKPFNLSGHITIYNRYDDSPGSGVSIIFKRSSDEPLPFTNTNFLFPLNDPPTQRSIPLYSSLDIVVDLIAVDEDDDNVSVRLTEDSRLPVEKYDTFCKHEIKGPEGHLDMNYIILTDPVDADLEMTFHPYCDVNDKLFHVTVWAFYGDNNDYGPFLLLDGFSPLLENGKIALNTPSIAVPATGYSLNIRATVGQIDGERDQKIFIGQSLKLTPKLKGSSSGCIHGVNCRIEVRVNWKYEADTEQNDDVAEDEIYTCEQCEELKTRDKLKKKKKKKTEGRQNRDKK